jgi:branched-chain amino acid transport system substrate-binding protein
VGHLRSRAVGLVACTLFAICGLSACGADSSQDQAASGEVKVGLSTSLSGSSAAVGKPALQGLSLGLSELNDKGGLLGRKITLVSKDDNGTPATGVTNARNLILRDRVSALFGPVLSSGAASEAQLAKQNQIPLIFLGSSDVSLTTTSYTPFSFEVWANSYMNPRAIASYLAPKPYTRYATISPDYVYGHNLADGFVDALKEFGANPSIVSQQWPPVGATDYSSYISAILAAKPDYVYIGLYGGDLLTFLKEAAGYQFLSKVKAAALWDEGVMTALAKSKSLPTGLTVWDPAVPMGIGKEAADAFAKAYKAKFGQAPTNQAEVAYVASQVWASGVRKAKSFDGAKVAAAIRGSAVPTLFGDLTIRTCDNQAEAPVYIGEVGSSVIPDYGYPPVTGLKEIPADNLLMSCAKSVAQHPK